MTPLEKKWILYDVGNSAFILLATTIIPILFNSLAEAHLSPTDYLAFWGYAVTVSTLIVAILGPILGAIADGKGRMKKFFAAFALLGIVSCILMPFFTIWYVFLVVYVISKVGFNGSLVFYDAMLTDITTEEKMDAVSSHGFAWGYIGSCIPFILSIGLIIFKDRFNLPMDLAMKIVFMLTGIWWLVFTIPLLKSYKQIHYVENKKVHPTIIFSQLWQTLLEIKSQKKVLLFLVAFFFYIDGVYTIINMATAYGTSLGLSSTGLILALLVTQIVAFPCALIFSKLSKNKPTDLLVKICIVAYALIALYGIQLDQLYEFWILAVAVGMFQGAIQALSRSYFAKIIPPEKSGEYFGIYDICGKGASIMGTLLVSVITQVTGRQQLAIGSLVVMFIIGFYCFHLANKVEFEN